MDFEFSITENIHRTKDGRIVKLDYRIDESSFIATSSTETTVTSQSNESRTVTSKVAITRERFDLFAKTLRNSWTFEEFIKVIVPLILGFYQGDELRQAFQIIDRDSSGMILIEELAAFLPLLNDSANVESLRLYVQQVDEDFNGSLDFDEFRSLILRGLGRDIICKKL